MMQPLDTNQTHTEVNEPEPTQIRFLMPDMCVIHLGSHGALHVTVKNERIYGGVFAAYAFPVAYPEGYISLIHSIGEGKDKEIGLIRDLNEWPKEQSDLVRAALKRRYFIHTIQRINHIGWKYGYISLDVETDKGPVSFMMSWQYDRAVDYGRGGKTLIDVDENRYLIPDVSKLSPREKSEFTRIIYW